MSAELYTATETDKNNGNHQTTTVGGSKPLHRFLKGQPKIMGIVVLIIGASFFIISIAITTGHAISFHVWVTIPPSFFLGTLFIISGILFILTELNPTKKTVTISLALSIVSILGACWTFLQILPNLHFSRGMEFFDENMTDVDWAWASSSEAMGVSVEALFAFYSFVGGIIFIVMSVLAGAALRSTRSQAVVVMSATSTSTSIE